ncbi:hypothetical protein QJS10_CPB19g01747 [Acorus calamus]|uniref:Peptidase M16 N-terminal domain-containing protein n=1 Tax=Acorus calamus TaxID=4465 RepID=A0AAV9CF60_ACOCL|nr:hypothetical protein QJS10_CPB19g01747 [Acorus calamus]
MERAVFLRSLSSSTKLLFRSTTTVTARLSPPLASPRSHRAFSSSAPLRRRRRHLLRRWAAAPAPSPLPKRPFSSLSPRAVSTSPVPSSSGTDGSHDIAESLGFEKISEQVINECKSTAVLYKHKKTGAEVMSVSNDDENKVFGIVFRTPPKDSTGIPHILEHSVLCGSRKYPLKEPFVELLKGSLNTFLNAFTYPDRTCYPVASTNTKDFYNLVDVYLDAVFFPKCVEDYQTFQQEGWHYELNNPEEEISFKGHTLND